jgi:hypothetical protein
MAYCITKSYGMANIRAIIPKWLAALSAGRDAAPRCTATTRTGKPCGNTRLQGADRCRHHFRSSQRAQVDLERMKRAQTVLQRSTEARRRMKAEATLRVAARAQLLRHWRTQDPDAPGCTFILPDSDERRIRKHLQTKYQINLDTYLHTGLEPPRGLSARAIDALRWAATLEVTRRITETSAATRVRRALEGDVRWFSKLGW